MSTVVFKDGQIACDTQGSIDGTFTHVYKSFEFEDGLLIGIVGDLSEALKFIDWYRNRSERSLEENNRIREELRQGEFGVMMYDREVLYTWEESMFPETIDMNRNKWHAIGSGRDAAMGALHAGADIYEAVQAAIYVDVNTGGSVVVKGKKNDE